MGGQFPNWGLVIILKCLNSNLKILADGYLNIMDLGDSKFLVTFGSDSDYYF